jgi:hypothetical protein
VDTFDDAMRIAAPGTENGTLAMMVFTYWEQARAFLNHGLCTKTCFLRAAASFSTLWELLKGIVPQGRIMDRKPLARSCYRPAANDEADARAICNRGESLNWSQKAPRGKTRPRGAQARRRERLYD